MLDKFIVLFRQRVTGRRPDPDAGDGSRDVIGGAVSRRWKKCLPELYNGSGRAPAVQSKQTILGAPDLVGALTVMMGDGPLDEVSMGATHELLMNAVKTKDVKEEAGARKNWPKL